MIPIAVIAHTSKGRLRVRITAYRGNLEALKSQGDQLAACPGILSVEINPGTGSILLLHQTTVPEIAEYAQSKDLFSLEQQTRTKIPSAELRRSLGATFKSVDRQIQNLTGGDIDLGGFAVAALVVAGSAQIVTGNATAIPWFAAYWYAYHLYSKTTEGGNKGKADGKTDESTYPPA